MARKHETKWSHIIYRVIILILIIIIILLLPRSCKKEIIQEDPFGDYEISDTKLDPSVETETEPPSKTGTIAFAGFVNYKVSQRSPNIRLENPASNRVEMVFTLTDKASGTLISRTEKVKPGNYAYINVMDFYSKTGVYDVYIKISTFEPVTGKEKNGLEQTIQIQVN